MRVFRAFVEILDKYRDWIVYLYLIGYNNDMMSRNNKTIEVNGDHMEFM